LLAHASLVAITAGLAFVGRVLDPARAASKDAAYALEEWSAVAL